MPIEEVRKLRQAYEDIAGTFGLTNAGPQCRNVKIAHISAPRKYNPVKRRSEIADAAIELLGTQGSRGLTHPRLDKHAGLPAGTTSYYFRSRQALLRGVAERITELDLGDLSMMDERSDRFEPRYGGTIGLSRLVILSGTEPYLTRTRARFELILNARQDPELTARMSTYDARFYTLAREVIARWYDGLSVPPSHIEERAVVVLTFISGIMTTFILGSPVVKDAEHLDDLIRQLLRQ
jgi:AcrR family transcriptional regulator